MNFFQRMMQHYGFKNPERLYWPDGKEDGKDFQDSAYVDGDFYVYGWYENPFYGATGTVTIIIYAEGNEIGRTSFTIQ